MTIFQRRLYGLVLRLHPTAFRDEFGREMTLDFEDALQERGFAALFCDALGSCVRQWMVRILPEAEERRPALTRPLLAGQYAMVSLSCLTPFDLARASVLAIALFLTIGFAVNIPNKRSVAYRQTAHASHDGGLSSANNSPPHAAGDEQRREAAGSQAYLLAPSYGVSPFPATARLHLQTEADRSRELPGIRGFSPTGTLWEVLRRCTLITLIVWLTSFLLRRSTSVGMRVILTALGLLGIAASTVVGSVHTRPIPVRTKAPAEMIVVVKPSAN